MCDTPEFSCGMSKRSTVAVLASLGFLISFGMRCNIGVAIFKMIQVDDATGTAEFDWDKGTIGLIDYSFFVGYLIAHLPGGFLATKYKANRIFGTAILLSSVLNLFIPLASRLGHQWLIVLRIGQGLVDGVTFPACHAMWRWWAPPLERSRLATLAFSGSYGGAVIGMPVSAWLVEAFGWDAPFYFYGAAGSVWYVFWVWLVFSTPREHPTISPQELDYIEKSIGPINTTWPTTCKTIPWKGIFSSMPVYAIIVANFCRSWTFYLLIISQPTYFAEAFKFYVGYGGILAVLPHLVMTLVVPVGGILADKLRTNKVLTTTQVRKVFNCGGFAMEAGLWLVVVAVKDNAALAIVALTLAAGCSGFGISGFNVNHLDIGPRYAGLLMGISQTVGTLASFLCPIATAKLTREHKISEWDQVFELAAMIHFGGVVFYGVFASGELQPWAEPRPLSEEEEEEMETTTARSERLLWGDPVDLNRRTD